MTVLSSRSYRRYSHASFRTHIGDPEPSVRELLDDPILDALMASDGVRRQDVEILIERARYRLGLDEATSCAFLEARLLLECD